MHNWIAGEEITAEKLNQLNPETDTRLSQAEHNILVLYLENYFASKNTPFQGLFFDGFSDNNKSNPAAGTLTAQAASGQTILPLISQAQLDTFFLGDSVQIYDGVHQELGIVQTKGNATITIANEPTLASGWTYTENDPDGDYSDAGVVSGRHRINMGYLQGHNGQSTFWQMAKAFSGLSVGATYTVTFQAFSLAGNPYQHSQYDWDYLQVLIDSTQIFNSGAHGGTSATGRDDPTNGQTVSVTFTATAASHTVKIWFGSHYTNIPMSYFELWNFSITQVAPALTLTSNLANTYAAGSNVKATSATLDTANKKLAMTAGVGDLKRTIYTSKKQSFFQAMEHVKLWVMRAVPVRFNPLVVLNNGDAQLTIKNLSIKSKFAVGDIIEISEGINRERKTLANVVENAGPVTIDGTSTFGGGSGTFNVTDHSSQNQMLIVKAVNSNYIFRGSEAVTGVTVNGQPMTQLGGTQESSDGVHGSIWYLKNPPIGSVTINVSVNYGGSIMFAVENVYNAQTIDTYTGVVWGTSVTVADNNANDLVTDLAYSWNTGTINSGAGQTPDGNTVGDGPNCFKATYKAGANGNVTMAESGGSQTSFTIVAIIRQATPQATLAITPAIQAAGYSTAANVDRVDVFPKLSLVDRGASASFGTPTFVQALETTLTGNELMVEDEYDYQPNSAGHDLIAQLIISRSDTTVSPYAKNLGVSLNT